MAAVSGPSTVVGDNPIADIAAADRMIAKGAFVEYEARNRLARGHNAVVVYPNQIATANHIMDLFDTNDVVVLLAPMQSGKTGVIFQVVKSFTLHDDEAVRVSYRNVWILSGMNLKEWQESMRESFPSILFRDRVMKLYDVNSSKDPIVNNSLIVIDESHVASKDTQSLARFFKDNHLQGNLRERNIKVLQVSATPDNTLFHIPEGAAWQIARLVLPETYVGPWKILDAGRVREIPKLDTRQDALEFMQVVNAEFPTPKYHIVRCKSGGKRKRQSGDSSMEALIRDCATSMGWDVTSHDQHDQKDRAFFEAAPDKHTVVFLKEMWRASVRVCDTHLGCLLETSSMDTSCIQGFVGRICGNDKQTPGPGSPLLYMYSVESVTKYVRVWKEEFDYSQVAGYRGQNIRVSTQGEVTAAKSMNATIMTANGVADDTPRSSDAPESGLVVMQFSPSQFQKAKTYCRKIEFNTAKLELLRDTTREHENTLRSNKKVFSLREVLDDCTYGIGEKNKRRAHLCYETVGDLSSLRLVIVSAT